MNDLNYLTPLNEVQRQAIEATEGPLLVLAGAGTGKTRVLTTRIVHLLASGRANLGEILAVTFTNKAAFEMQERVAALLGRPVAGMAIGTFHSISARFLRTHAEMAGLKSDFTILDDDDQVRLIKQLLQVENIDEKRWPARLMGSWIGRWKNRALTPDKVPAGEARAYADGKGLKIYQAYQQRLKILNACDFGDLLLHVLTIFQNNQDILTQYQQRFKYLLVDEYQDTNVAQYLWLRLLAGSRHNICCVGDDDQSIYSWRGAEVENILRFEKDFPEAQVIRLEQNYRSTGHILAAASGLIAANKGRMGKTLWTSGEMGAKVEVRNLWDGREEARFVGDQVETLQSAKISLNEMAVLIRAGSQTRTFEERFITLGIPYRIVGGPRFYERREVRDAVAYLRIIAQPH
ncbi:MAG: UvrD-helicase domain-containing protein, partial [Proteobacteria bacterium]|nr:UvrD-helicase domain-containing protein [Pseudomonadota bacterium]